MNFKRMAAVVACVVVLAGCAHDPVSVSPTTNSQVDVGVLFDYDGCRVYRFSDGGHFVYFVRCGSDTRTAWGVTENHGKTSSTHYYEVQTIEQR